MIRAPQGPVIKWKEERSIRISGYERETIICFNASDDVATLYTCDPSVMRRAEDLVKSDPVRYRCIGRTKLDRTYEIPKEAVSCHGIRKHACVQEENERCLAAL